MQIRPATLADIPAVLPMVNQICALHEDWDAGRYGFVPNPAQHYESWLKGRVSEVNDIFLVADPEAAQANVEPLAGFLVATREREIPIYQLSEYGFIHDLWVAPAYRQSGIGKALIQTALQQFAQSGIRQIRLDTATANESARRLFQDCGFRVSTIEMLAEIGDAADC